MGLVGPNGVGKTTLLLVLAGLAQPSAGSVQIARGTRLGYLPQEAAQAFAGQENSVFDEMLTVFDTLREDEAALRQMEQQMAEGDHSEELMASYSQRQERFEHAGGYDYQIRIRQVLTGLGFAEEDWQMPLPHLSGGQKTRLLLGRLLLDTGCCAFGRCYFSLFGGAACKYPPVPWPHRFGNSSRAASRPG